ncbi:MAG: tetratricopeptide repeat protein [Acidimicrobiales bacterium]
MITLTEQDREALEAERDFLLASIHDLDLERDAGELADDRYEALVSGYTARAARILRALDAADTQAEPAAEAGRPSPAWRRRLVVLAPLAIVVALAALLLPKALSDRERGQTLTGNAQSSGDTGAGLARAVQERPDDPAAHRAYAGYLLDTGELVEALRQFDEAARLDPADPESRAYAGWIVFRAGLTDDALDRIDAAIAVDPTYPDAHFFRGMVLARGRADATGAAAELRRYLELVPGTPMREQIEAFLAELEPPPSPSEPIGPEPGNGQ